MTAPQSIQPIPVVIFGYNRPNHLKQTLDALSGNYGHQDIPVTIYLDGRKANDETNATDNTIKVAENYKGKSLFKSYRVITSKHNRGLAKSVIRGVNEQFRGSDKLIVLEDDLVTSRDFYSFMCDTLNTYEADQIWSVSGYTPKINLPKEVGEIFTSTRANSWGWGMHKENWKKVDWNYTNLNLSLQNIRLLDTGGADLKIYVSAQRRGLIDSWATIWCYYALLSKKYVIYPVESKVENIGIDNSGTHSRRENINPNFLVKARERPINIANYHGFNKKINQDFLKNFDISPKTSLLFYLSFIKSLLHAKKQ